MQQLGDAAFEDFKRRDLAYIKLKMQTCGPLMEIRKLAEWLPVLQALGADLVYMGTRFLATQESNAQDEFKQMVIDCGVSDLIYTDRLSGVYANFLKPSLDRFGIDVTKLPPKKPDMSSLTDTSAKLWKDLWSVGHGIATIHDLPSVSELVLQIAAQYDSACQLGRSAAIKVPLHP